MPKADATRRFSNRVENYQRYRPRYPARILDVLKGECELKDTSVIGDIGSGTGFLTELFLANGNRVFGVEPNWEMRREAERALQAYPNFTSVDARAEATTLPEQSLDFITVGQAFHWFDPQRCRHEFLRILRASGWVVLVWNDRRTDTTPFLAGYEQLLHTYATDYAQVDHKRIDAAVLAQFFGSEPCPRVFPNCQHFDLPALKGRLLSSSYVPVAGEPGHAEMVQALERLFSTHQPGGLVTFEYDVRMYFARLAANTTNSSSSD